MKWQPGAQRSEATGPNCGKIRSLRCAPFPATIIFGEFVSDLYRTPSQSVDKFTIFTDFTVISLRFIPAFI
ncbi:MAG: hypothetical protein FWC43_09235, partial [Planctomycetaceae bacterium]|nr:hypothetical protein [Planctomycetaceae bacterium]